VTGDSPRDIPAAIKRDVRRRCGFGCVICGRPLYEYDHILGFAATRRHVAAEIALLCDLHHKEKTNGLLPPSKLEAANAEPHNLRAGISTPYNFHYEGSHCHVALGSMRFDADVGGLGAALVPCTIDDVAPIWFAFQDGHYLLNLVWFDDNGDVVLEIVDNWLAYATKPWDITLTGRHLIVREASHRVLVDMTFEPPNTISINRAVFRRNGIELLITKDFLGVLNSKNAFSHITIRSGAIPHATRIFAVGETPAESPRLITVPIRPETRRAYSQTERTKFVRARTRLIERVRRKGG
jgi:hypothetical protein